MSHFTKITAQIKDLEVLAKAAKKMGFESEKNAQCRYYYGKEYKDFVIKLPGQYDIAATKTGDHYDLEADFYNNHVSKYVGQNGSILLQRYAAEKAKIEAFKNGLGVTEKVQSDKILLTMTDPDTGGQINVECYPNGQTEVKTSGFQGQECMKFKNIEEALGEVQSTSHTSEYYLPEREKGVEYVHTDY